VRAPFYSGRRRARVRVVGAIASPMMLNGINTQGSSGIIGHAPEPAFGTNMGLDGTIDELRIATTARNAGWIAAEYANQRLAEHVLQRRRRRGRSVARPPSAVS
jgi:hypothetical protein